MSFRLIIMTVLLVGGLLGCSNSNNDQINNESISENEDQDPTLTDNDQQMNPDQDQSMDPDGEHIVLQMERLPFTEFELEVKYDNDIEFEAEVERESDGFYKVKLEDEIDNINLKGREAFEHIYPNLKNITFTNEADKKEIFDNVLSAFDLAEDYSEIEVEIRFNDGSEHKYKEKR